MGRIFPLLLLACFLPSSCFAVVINEASELRLSNGMKVILLENRKAPLVTFQVWYRAGSRNERVGRTGLAHLMEHMMFKGTQKVGGEEFTRLIEESGGEENAFTSHDFAAYFETMSADRIGLSIGLESDRMRNLVLRESDFNTERMVVIEERRMRVDDDPGAALLEQLESAAYQSQPYHWPVIGWPDDLERLTIEDVRAYYRDFYNPANAFIVVVGDFNKDALASELEKAFGSIPAGPPRELLSIQDPPQKGGRRIVLERPSQLGTVLAAFHVPNLRSPDAYVLEVVEALLSGGRSSRYYERVVRGKRLVIEAGADFSFAVQDPGLFYVSASYLPDKDAAAVEAALYEELEQLKQVPVEPRELEKAKNQLEAAFVFEQDSIFSLGMNLALHEIALDWRAAGNYVPSIRSVTPEDVRRVAAKYFTPENRTVAVLVPTASPAKTPLPSPGGMKEKMIR